MPIQVVFELPDGAIEIHNGKAGETVMDVALDNGVPGIIAQCGGGCTCCTCHCWIDPEWWAAVGPAHQDELDLLAFAWGVSEHSRLACQVQLDQRLNGLRVRVPEQQA